MSALVDISTKMISGEFFIKTEIPHMWGIR